MEKVSFNKSGCESAFGGDFAKGFARTGRFSRLQCLRQRSLVAETAYRDRGFNRVGVRDFQLCADLVSLDSGEPVRMPSSQTGLQRKIAPRGAAVERMTERRHFVCRAGRDKRTL